MKVLHLRGTHFNLFSWLRFRKDQVSFKVKFNENSRYTINSEDQGDYNKVIGLNPRFMRSSLLDSAMVAWRYLPAEDKIELNLYWHDSSTRSEANPNGMHWNSFGHDEPFLVPIGLEVLGNISMERKQNDFVAWLEAHFPDGKVRRIFMFTEHKSLPKSWICRVINAWFGGNRTPNKNVCYDLKILKFNKLFS